MCRSSSFWPTSRNAAFLLFDFRLVTGLDSSATYSFSQIKDAADEAGARIVLVNLTPELERIFRVARFLDERRAGGRRPWTRRWSIARNR